MMEQGEWLTRREAAQLLGVHYNTVRLWENRGRLSPIRVRRGGVEEVRIPRSELEAIAADASAVEDLEGADEKFEEKLKAAREKLRVGGGLPPARELLNLVRQLDAENKALREELSQARLRLDSENALLREELAESRRITERLLDTIQALTGQRAARGETEED